MSAQWPSVDLGDVCAVIAGQSPSGYSFNTNAEGLPFYQGKKDFTDRYIGAPTVWTTEVIKEALAGDILMSVRAPVGPINYATQRICIGRGLAAIRPTGIDPEFLFYNLLSKQSEIAGREGAVFASINREEIKRISVSLPPLNEQQRIVAVLDQALGGIDAATALVDAQLEQIREVRSVALASCLRSASGPEVRLTDHVDMLVGFAFKSGDYVNGPEAIRLLRGDNIAPGSVRWVDAKAFPGERAAEFDRYQLAVDDVVIAMDRPWIKSGLKQAKLTAADVPSLLVQRVARLRCGPAMKVGYLQHLIASPMFESHVLKHAGGSGVPHISGGQLGAFSFALPTLRDQENIIQRLDEVLASYSALTNARHRKLALLAELKQSLLVRAFTGELTHEPPAA